MPDLPSPGWYPDPEQPQTKRYWDGQAWTDQRAPIEEGGEGAPGWMLAVGYLGAFLLPLVGFIVGIVLLVRRQFGHGIAIVGISVAVAVGGYLITVNDDDDDNGGPKHKAERRNDRK